MRSLNKLQPYGLLLVRLAAGVSMVYHGYEKIVAPAGFHFHDPWAGFRYFAVFVVSLHLPVLLAYVSIATEFVGGFFLVLGFVTRFSAFMVAGNMIVALVTVNLKHGYAGSEYTLALIAMSLLLMTTGSGALALDRKFGIS